MLSINATPIISINSMQFSAKPVVRAVVMVALATLVGLISWSASTAGGLAEDQLYSIAVALITLSGTSLGFLITAVSIFAALFTRELVQKLAKTGHYAQLVRLLFSAAALFLICAIASISAMFFQGNLLASAVSVAIGFVTLSLLLFARAGYHFYLVLSHVE